MTAVLEDVQSISIDKWGSLNTAASSGKLPEGQSPDNQNVWMDEKPGSLVTANGYIKLGTMPFDVPITFMINFFKTSDGSSVVVLSDGEKVWKTTNFVNFDYVWEGLSPFFQLRGMVIRNKLWLTNGSDPVMTYDGTTLTVLDGTGGTPDVPIAKYISYHDERVWLYGISGDPSSLRFSDLADSSGTEIAPDDPNAWPSDNEVQVAEGDDDIGTGLFLYRGYLYASKSFSIWRIVGYDEYTYTRVKTRASTGTRFQESVKEVDNLVHLIGVDGLYTFDGEETKRISDIIDPASSEPGVFAFRNLQQPLLNNTFWNVSQSVDWAAGTVPNVLDTTNDRLTLVPADDSQADFNSGAKTRVTADDNPGYLQLALVSTGSAGTLRSSGKAATLNAGLTQVGVASSITDGNFSSYVGFANGSGSVAGAWQIDLGAAYPIGQAVVKSFYLESNTNLSISYAKIQYSSDNSSWSDAVTLSTPSIVNHNPSVPGIFVPLVRNTIGASDITGNFATTTARYWRLLVVADTSGGAMLITELQIYQAGYEADGKFVSSTIDYTAIPASFGALAASITTNGEAYQFFTQSSADGSSWDAEANLANGAAIGSTLRRYLRWGAYLYSSTGISTPVIAKVFVGGTYLSEIHDTGGNIFQWGAFQLEVNKLGQTINAYYRAAPTSGGVSAQSWTPIVPGAIPSAAVTDTFIQIRLELSTADATFAPYVTSFTANWIVGTGSGVNTLQNVASFVWLNRYWLSAATLGADANDVVIVRGKSTFGSPWHKKDFAILSFCRFQDYFIAGSSTDGSIYRLETGYSKAGAAMDSYFETGDFTKPGGFMYQGYEIVINADRLGPYTVSVGISIDGGITYTEKTVDLTRATLSTNLSFTKKLNVNFMADKFRIRIRNNAADQPFSVDGLDVFYRLLPERGSLN